MTYRHGDIVAVDHKGRQFMAQVSDEQPDNAQLLMVKPLGPNITYFTISRRDVKGLWRRSKGAVLPKVTSRGGVRF